MVCFSNVYVQNKMAINEEDLSISVQKYTVLFDKGHKEFHRKDVKENVWKAVAEELGFYSYSTMLLLHSYDGDDVFLR